MRVTLCLFSALRRRVGALQISIIITIQHLYQYGLMKLQKKIRLPIIREASASQNV